MTALRARLAELSGRVQAWADRRDPRTVTGIAIATWRSYRAIDGPLQSALLSLYFLVAVLPALLVMEELQNSRPSALANRLVHHYGLSGSTAQLLRSVLVQNRAHELGTALLAIAGALFFGLGFGRVLQLVHARAWKVTLPTRQTDQVRYAFVLFGLYGLILLLLLELNHLGGNPSWPRLAVAPGWAALLVLYFAWAARLLLHDLIGWRDVLPGAVLSAVGLIVLFWGSSYLMERWVDFYARDYGGFGVVMAIYFWLAFGSAIIVVAAALGPALAVRRAGQSPAAEQNARAVAR